MHLVGTIAQKESEAGVQFPDWNGMSPHRTRMSFEEACQWNEEMLELFPPKPHRAALAAEAKCRVEFVL